MSAANGEYPRLSGSPWRPASEPPKQTEWVIASADGVVRCVAWNSDKRCWEDWDEHGAINLDGIDWWMSIPDMPEKPNSEACAKTASEAEKGEG